LRKGIALAEFHQSTLCTTDKHVPCYMSSVCNIKNIWENLARAQQKVSPLSHPKGCAHPWNAAATTPPEALKVPTKARQMAAHHTSRGYPREGIENS